MSEVKTYPVPAAVRERAHIDEATYQAMYQRSLDDPAGFWAEQATAFLEWFEPWHTVVDSDLNKGEIRFFSGGKLNVAHNCLDRHLATRADQTAIIWEGDNPDESLHISYRELHERVCRFANAMKAQGRSGLHLPADDSRCGGGHAGLRAHWRGALHRLRRLFARCAGRARPDCQCAHTHHRRRRPARWPRRATEGERRRGA
jgi:hypothetical protein